MITIAMADDHVLLRQGLASLVESFGEYKVVAQASNGKELMEMMLNGMKPELVLLDISMPEMNGFETAARIKANYPEIKILALSMMDSEEAIIKMIRSGAGGYVLKDAEPAELKKALHDLYEKGFYFSELVTGRLMHQVIQDQHPETSNKLNAREIEFLKYVCTEMTYKEIAAVMHVSPRTVDGYRDALFEKLQLKTRVGLAMYAVRLGMVAV